jgi:hypothetical protein
MIAAIIRDTLRAVLAVAVMAAAAGLAVEARYQMAAIDTAARACSTMPGPAACWTIPAHDRVPEDPGRLRRLGRSMLDLADAALNVVR